jgi:hypothetical protein
LKPITELLKPINELLKPITGLLRPINELLRPINELLKPINELLRPINDVGSSQTDFGTFPKPLSIKNFEKMNLKSQELLSPMGRRSPASRRPREKSGRGCVLNVHCYA